MKTAAGDSGRPRFGKTLAAFAEIIRVAFKHLIQYRWTFAVTVATQPFVLLVNLALFRSVYAYNQTDSIKGYRLDQMAWYFLSYQLVNAFVWNGVAGHLSEDILSGDLTGHLLKPFSVLRMELGYSLASRLIALFMDFCPTLIICGLILFPGFLTPVSLLRFAVVVVPAFFINFFCAFLLGLLALPMKNNSAVNAINNLIIVFVGGALIPLEFFPDAVNRVLDFLPFKYIYYWPIQFFLNKSPADNWLECLKIAGIGLAWMAGLYVLCKLAWRGLVKKYCAAGG
jgi:ABC-2 type transport system permease protein